MIEVVCGVIEDGEGRFLACLRPQGKHLGGHWEFPGGKVDPGESPEIALIRELREELGIEVAVGEPLAPVIWSYERGAIRLLPFWCSVIHGDPQALEHERLLWCAPADFDSLLWAAADLPILSRIRGDRGFALTGDAAKPESRSA